MEKQTTNTQTWLKMDMQMQSGSIWWNEKQDRLVKRRKRQKSIISKNR